jgi:hypothetical protein
MKEIIASMESVILLPTFSEAVLIKATLQQALATGQLKSWSEPDYEDDLSTLFSKPWKNQRHIHPV